MPTSGESQERDECPDCETTIKTGMRVEAGQPSLGLSLHPELDP